jgi:lipoyl(octanoyl) transferase
MHSQPREATENMALDEAMLLTAAETGETLVRLYSWSRPSVSFGRNQRCAGNYTPERCAALGVPAVRRLTGGRALLHAREVTYAVAAPNSAAATLRGGYEAINDLLLAALHDLGVDAARATPRSRTPSPDLAPCFESPSTGELVVGTRKLVGSAQHRGEHAFLQHGSILIDDDQSMLNALSLVPLPVVPTPATLRGCGHGAAMLVAALDAALREFVTGDIVETSDSTLPARHVEAAASRYRDPRWTWRR